MITIPFSGSKKYSYKNVKAIVEAGKYTTVYEPFGGSCVLSANLFNDGIVSRAVVNDYDGLFDIYPKYLDYKDWVVKECEEYGIVRRIKAKVKGKNMSYTYDEDGNRVEIPYKLSPDECEFLQNLMSQVPKKYWRLFACGSNFTHSAVSAHKYIHLNDFCYFSNHLKTDKQRAYLEIINEIERESLDYRVFFEKYKDQFDSKSIIIADPPYYNTAQEQYADEFSEAQTIDLLRKLKSFGTDFIFFNHDVNTVSQWLKTAGIDNYQINLTGCANSSANRKRKDVMIYVKFNHENN